MDTLEFLRATVQPLITPGANPDALGDRIAAMLDDATVKDIYQRLTADDIARRLGRFDALFPDEGPLRRELYARHLEHFEAGRTYRERLFLAANRVGKTIAGGYETACHLTGDYPEWWPGRRFRRPVRAWVAGDTNETTRDVLQLELLGEIAYRGNRKIVDGSGLIKRDFLGEPTWKQGVQNLVDTIPIRHKSGGVSLLGLKSYDQGRRAFQGTAKELIWLDEECPMDVYNECLVRTATTRGIIMLTYTPILGLSEVTLSFLPSGYTPE